jgi:hypothetical protein
VKNGKISEKIKRKRISCFAGPEGGDFGPLVRERARGRGWRPSWPSSEGTAGDDAAVRGPHARVGAGAYRRGR